MGANVKLNTMITEAQPNTLITKDGEEIKADAATTFTATKIFASDALTNGSLAKNLMFAQTTKGVLETGIYRGVVSIYLSQDI